jgi:hypothetical protein
VNKDYYTVWNEIVAIVTVIVPLVAEGSFSMLQRIFLSLFAVVANILARIVY